MNPVPTFKYSGPIESSKSIVNRALILQAIHPNLNLTYQSKAKDVEELNLALEKFKTLRQPLKSDLRNALLKKSKDRQDVDAERCNSQDSHITFDVGSGGTTFRFLVLYLSKFLGTWTLKMSTQLARRPKEDLLNILKQLGVTVISPLGLESKFEKNLDCYFQIKSQFWTTTEVIVDFAKSSQFFSGLALSASDSSSPFKIKCLNRDHSSGYEAITLEMLRKIGINVDDKGSAVILQKPINLDTKKDILIGADWSSVIYILSFCFTGSEITITNIDFNSLEPDKKGLEYLKHLGLDFESHTVNNFSSIKCRPSHFSSLIETVDLTKNPDLFPIFVVLLSQKSLMENKPLNLKFPQQLIYKESDRLNSMLDILAQIGFETDIKDQVLTLSPKSLSFELKNNKSFALDSKSDHRIIMSFELLKSFGYKITYSHADEVKKSFSNFFEILKGVHL